MSSEEKYHELIDVWECLDHIQLKNKISQNLSNAFEEVKDFLSLKIDELEKTIQDQEEYSNIDLIIDKIKGS